MQGLLNECYKFKIVDGTRLGKGCFAREKILDGEIICKMSGPIISLKDFFDKYDIDGCNPLQISADTYIDMIEPYVFFNHSCSPNAGIRNDGILFALKDIFPGDEIFYDYSTTVDENIWSMRCECLSENCRKIIADFQTIPHEQKQYYFSKNALTKHILNMYY